MPRKEHRRHTTTPDLAHVPFVLRAPGVPVVRRSEPVSHLDVMPTLLEAAGIPAPEGLRGIALGPALRSGEPLPGRLVYCDMGFENFATAKPADDPESTAPKLKRCDVNLNGVSFANDLDGWTAGEFGVILRTRDGGKNWEKQANVHNLPKYTRPSLSEEEAIRQRIPPLYLEDLFLIDVDFRSAQEGYVTGESGILLKTEDAGESWTNIPSGSFNTLLSISAAPSGNRSDMATGVLGTLTSGKSGSWQLDDKVRQTVLTWIRTTSFAADGRFGVACGGKGTVLITTDGGNTWKATDKAKLYATNPSLPSLPSLASSL